MAAPNADGAGGTRNSNDSSLRLAGANAAFQA